MGRESTTGQRVWITGASSGIGAALARELADRGARVAVSARRQDELTAVAAGRMTVVPVDVTDAAAVRAVADTVRAALGGIDVVVLNAGMWRQVRLADLDIAVVAAHLDVNVMGVVNGLAAVIGPMLERGRGTVAIVASVAGYRGIPGSLAYGATKAALINLAESIRPEARRAGVRVVTVCPGFVRTPLTDRNTFTMPFMLEVDDAARRIADGLTSRRQEIVFPLPVAVGMKLARVLPLRVWTRLTAFAVRRRSAPATSVRGS